MLKFTLKFEEVFDGQLPFEISSKKVGCEGWTQARLEGVTSSRTISVTHTHTGLGANDALNLKRCKPPSRKTLQSKKLEKNDCLLIVYSLPSLCYNSFFCFTLLKKVFIAESIIDVSPPPPINPLTHSLPHPKAFPALLSVCGYAYMHIICISSRPS